MKKCLLATLLPLAISTALADEIPSIEPSYLQLPQTPEEIEFAPLKGRKNSLIAVGLAALCPGLGHVYLGEYQTAGSLFGSYGVFAGLTAIDENITLRNFNATVAFNLNNYNLYAAYRDVRGYNLNQGYRYQMPQENFFELAQAPFRLSVLKKPEVWGGVLGALAIGTTIGYLVHSDEQTPSHAALSSELEIFPLAAFPVAIGEEAFFRGFLQSALSEWMNPWASIAISSLAFGVVHLPNAILLPPEGRKNYYRFSIPLITTFGAYFGYLTYKNHSLQESVAIHAWYDFVLFLASYSAAHSASIGKPCFAFSAAF